MPRGPRAWTAKSCGPSSTRSARVAHHDHVVKIARIIDARVIQTEVSRADQERVQLVSSRGAVCSDLVVERHDLVAVVRAEDRDVARVALRHQMPKRLDHELARTIRLERIGSVQHLETRLTVLTPIDHRATGVTLDMDG